MNSLISVVLIATAFILCYLTYKIRKIEKVIQDIYNLPHGESLHSINHHEFNSVSLQYVLIAVRTCMYTWMQQCVAVENYESAENWKRAIGEVEKLIKTKINK